MVVYCCVHVSDAHCLLGLRWPHAVVLASWLAVTHLTTASVCMRCCTIRTCVDTIRINLYLDRTYAIDVTGCWYSCMHCPTSVIMFLRLCRSSAPCPRSSARSMHSIRPRHRAPLRSGVSEGSARTLPPTLMTSVGATSRHHSTQSTSGSGGASEVSGRVVSSVAEPPLPDPDDATLDRGTPSESYAARKWATFPGCVPLWVADMVRDPRPLHSHLMS